MIPDPFNPVQEGGDALEEGYFLIQRWRSGRVPIPVRIWYGPPVDPDTGEPMDRSWRWQVAIAGVVLGGDPVTIGWRRFDDLSDFWPACRREPIDAADYAYRIERAAWAAEHDPNDPYGLPGGKIDPLTASLPPL